jgi:adenosylcobinamide-GDP ribazoletransferase
MKSFIAALQFLTCIRVSNEREWPPQSFGKSVKFFPLVGAVIGFLLVCIYIILGLFLPKLALVAIILAAWIFLTGGLHLDGLMDTADGVFSGKPRDKMLEIMKDSRVGANGVMAFGIVFILKFAIIYDMPTDLLLMALFVAPVAGRLAMSASIVLFPYARADGMGKAFKEFACKDTLTIAGLVSYLLIAPFILSDKIIFLGVLFGVLTALLLARSLNKTLGGLTGDTYGAIAECCEIFTLLFILMLNVF